MTQHKSKIYTWYDLYELLKSTIQYLRLKGIPDSIYELGVEMDYGTKDIMNDTYNVLSDSNKYWSDDEGSVMVLFESECLYPIQHRKITTHIPIYFVPNPNMDYGEVRIRVNLFSHFEPSGAVAKHFFSVMN